MSAFENCESLTEVTLPGSLTEIGDSAFRGCINITIIVMRNNVTIIGNYAFYGCINIVKITISVNVTVIGNYAFGGCGKLTTIVYQGGEVGWSEIEKGEGWDDGLPEVEITEPSGEENKCTEAEWYAIIEALGGVNSVTMTGHSISADNRTGATKKVTTTLKLTKDVTYIYGLHENGSSAGYVYEEYFVKDGSLYTEYFRSHDEGVAWSDWKCYPNKSMGFAMADLVTILPNDYSLYEYDVDSGYMIATDVEWYSEALNYTISYKRVVIGIVDGKLNYMAAEFNQPVNLGMNIYSLEFYYTNYGSTSLELPNFEEDTVQEGEMDGVIYTLSRDRTYYLVTGYSVVSDKVVIQARYNDLPVKEIDENAFIGHYTLKEVVIPEGITAIDRRAFSSCISLTSVTIPNSVTVIGQDAFAYCSNLKSVVIGDGLTTIITGTFWECTSLQSIVFGDGLKEIQRAAFMDCTNLTTVTMGKNVESIGISAFSNCCSLTSIVLSSSVTTIGEYAFDNCISLTIYCEAASKPSGWDSDWLGYSEDEGIAVVWNCNNNDVAEDGLVYTIVDGLRYALYEGEAVLVKQPCNITEVNIPQSITYKGGQYPVTKIGDLAFYMSFNLTNLVIPAHIQSVGMGACAFCPNLTSVVILGDETEIGLMAFTGSPNLRNIQVSEDHLYYQTIDGSLYSKDGTILLQYAGEAEEFVVPDFVEEIGMGAFACAEHLKRVVIGDNVMCIGGNAFYECPNLTSVVIGNGVEEIGNDAFYGCSNLTSTILGSSVKIIGREAFSYCENLTSINIPASVTTIGEGAFEECTSLTSVVIPGGVTTISERAFSDCSSLTSVIIGDGVKTIGYAAFAYCYSLTTVDISNSVTSIEGSAFAYCYRLTNVVIPESVTSIGNYAFSNCYHLTSILLHDGVTSMGMYVFNGCSDLVIYCEAESQPSGWHSNWDSANFVVWGCNGEVASDGYVYTVIGGVCYALKDGEATVVVQAEETETANIVATVTHNGEQYFVTAIAPGAFAGCSDYLVGLIIPDGVTSIGEGAFEDCYKLTSVIIPDSVTSIGANAFDGCYNLTIYCEVASRPSGWASSWSGACTVYWDCLNNVGDSVVNGTEVEINGLRYRLQDGQASLTTQDWDILYAYIPETVVYKGVEYTVTAIGPFAFENCNHLRSVSIPASITMIGNEAFAHCYSLDSVYITDLSAWCKISFGGEPLDYVSGLYLNNELVTDLVIPDDVTSISDYAFYGYSTLMSVVLHENVTSIGGHAFAGCYNLKEIVIPSSVTEIRYGAFSGCDSLKSVIIPDTVTWMDDAVFSGCESLISVDIGDGVPYIGERVFAKCDNLQSVVIGSGVTEIDQLLFEECYNLTNIIVDPNNKAYQSIDGNLYTKDGKGLLQYAVGKTQTSFDVPDGVTTIGGYAFYGCTNLQAVSIPDSVVCIQRYAFENSGVQYNYYGCCKYLGNAENPYYALIHASYTPSAACSIHADTKIIADFAFANNPSSVPPEANSKLVIPQGVLVIGEGAFSGCNYLKSVVIPDSVVLLGVGAFYYCGGLQSVVIGDGVKTISRTVFSSCYALESVVIGDGVETIDEAAFYRCLSLTTLVVGGSVTVVGEEAFCECRDLAAVYVKGNLEDFMELEMGPGNDSVDSSSVEFYFYMENEADVPDDGWNYWHYDENGKIAIW